MNEKGNVSERERRDWIIILIILLLGFLCVIIAGERAVRFSPTWKLDTSMQSNLDPDSDFLTNKPVSYFEPLDLSILTQPVWVDIFLTPGSSFETRTAAPNITNTPVATNTPVPTVVNSPTAIISATSTSTLLVASPTNTPYFPPFPTSTHTKIPTTSVVSATPSPTGTSMHTATATLTPAQTLTPTSTGSVTQTPTNIPTATNTPPTPASVDLSITKTDGVSIYMAGGSVTYTIVVSNPGGPNGVNGATVTDTFPAQITSANWTCIPSGGGTCSANGSGNINDTVNLPIGSFVTYTVNATVGSSVSGNLVNIASVSVPAGYTDPNSGNNSATDTDTLFVPLSADLQITKTDGSPTYVAGSTISYTIVVTNNGPSNVTGATISDPKPVQVTTWGWCVAPCTPVTNSNTGLSDTVNLASGASITYAVSANINSSATGALTNRALVGVPAGYTDPIPGNNSAEDIDSYQPSADLQITKNDGGTVYKAGDTIVYTIVVSNMGPDDVTGATVSDNLPAQVTSWDWACATVTNASGCDGTVGSSANFTDIVDIQSGGSIEYTVSAIISASPSGNLVNTATVSEPVGIFDPISNNSATDTDELAANFPYGGIGTTPGGGYETLPSGSSITLAFGSPITVGGPTGDYDLVYYEFANGSGIFMDFVILEIYNGTTWYTILNWGDGSPDVYTSINISVIGGSETDNRDISSVYLYPPLPPTGTGVAIDLEGIVPAGTYYYIRITSPSGDTGDGLEVDAIEILP